MNLTTIWCCRSLETRLKIRRQPHILNGHRSRLICMWRRRRCKSRPPRFQVSPPSAMYDSFEELLTFLQVSHRDGWADLCTERSSNPQIITGNKFLTYHFTTAPAIKLPRVVELDEHQLNRRNASIKSQHQQPKRAN